MDKYLKWIIFLIILLAVTVGLTVYFSFFYNPGDVGLSPIENNLNNTNASNGLIIDDREPEGFERNLPGENKGDKIEGNASKENKSGYWIQELPDSGGALTITPLIIYDKLTKTKNILVTIVLVLGIVIYITFKIRKKVVKKEMTNRFT